MNHESINFIILVMQFTPALKTFVLKKALFDMWKVIQIKETQPLGAPENVIKK